MCTISGVESNDLNIDLVTNILQILVININFKHCFHTNNSLSSGERFGSNGLVVPRLFEEKRGM
jgi:hypothetical protein